MQPPRPLSKVPNPVFLGIQDITLFVLYGTTPIKMFADLCGSSLEGQRSIADFFHILDHFINVVGANDYKLQQLNNCDTSLASLAGPPVIERSSVGNIVAGNYLIVSAVEGGEITFKVFPTLFERINSPLESMAKRTKYNTGGSTASERLTRDPADNGQGFTMRLVYRDKGCAVCLAAGIQKFYKYCDDYNYFKGSHIINIAFHELWDSRGYSTLVSDPYTDPANANSVFASPTTQTKKDFRQINSLENGILLCLQHHGDYKNFRFAIHPETHKIFSFHPTTVILQGLEVKVPWNLQDGQYPPPHHTFLMMHYFTSIFRAMITTKDSGGDFEMDDDDDDEHYEGLSDPDSEEVHNEQVRI